MKIAISTFALDGKIPSGDPRWKSFNSSFENHDVSLMDLANAIWMGHAITTQHKETRRTENFICGQHIGFDFDTEDQRSTFEHLRKVTLIAKFACLLYQTPSHTLAAPRARVIFQLDTPIYQAANYVRAVEAITLTMGEGNDTQCKDAVRFFYGSKGADIVPLEGVLPLARVRAMIATHERHKAQHVQPATPRPDTTGDTTYALQWAIQQGSEGGRNATGFNLACMLAKNDISLSKAEQTMRQYQFAVTTAGNPYTEQEALQTLRGVYRGKV